MTVPSNHVYVKGGDSLVDALEDVLDRAEAVVTDAAEEQIHAHHDRMQQQALLDDSWREMAPDITYWTDEGGNVAYGIPLWHPKYEHAVETEYGSHRVPPSPLIRMGVVNGVAQIGWSMQQAFMEGGFG